MGRSVYGFKWQFVTLFLSSADISLLSFDSGSLCPFLFAVLLICDVPFLVHFVQFSSVLSSSFHCCPLSGLRVLFSWALAGITMHISFFLVILPTVTGIMGKLTDGWCSSFSGHLFYSPMNCKSWIESWLESNRSEILFLGHFQIGLLVLNIAS